VTALAQGNRWRLLIPIALFVIALSIRLVGIGWGLKNELHNQSYHPDEPVNWMYSQQIEPAKLKFTPGFYKYGTLYLTGLRIVSDMTAAYSGGPDPKNPDATWAFVSRCHLAGRVLGAIGGALTVLLVFLMLRRFIGLLGAGAAAALIAVAPGHVVHSRFQTVDVFATLLLVASAFFALRLIPEGEEPIPQKAFMRDLLLSAAFAGLSAGTKYTGALGLVTLLAILFLCHRPRFLKDAAIGLGVCVLAFLISTPGALLEHDKFMEDFGFEMGHAAAGHGLVFAGTSSGFLYHFGNLQSGIGTILVLIGLAGLGYAAYRRHKWAIALLVFFVPYYILIGRAQDKYMRYTFPLYLGVAAGFGYAVSAGQRKGGWGRSVVALGILGLGGVDSGGLVRTARYTAWMVGEDPRDATARGLKKEADKNPNAVVGLASDPWYWSPPLFPDAPEPRSVPLPTRMAQMAAAQHPAVTFFQPPDAPAHVFDDRLITLTKPDFVVFSTLESTPMTNLLGVDTPATFASLDKAAQTERVNRLETGKIAAGQFASFVQALSADYELADLQGEHADPVEDMQYVQPELYIWKRKAPKTP